MDSRNLPKEQLTVVDNAVSVIDRPLENVDGKDIMTAVMLLRDARNAINAVVIGDQIDFVFLFQPSRSLSADHPPPGVAAPESTFHLLKLSRNPPSRWRRKGETCYAVSVVARRPAPEEFDKPLTPEELAERQRRLSMLSPHHVADAYRQAHEACRMDGDRLPRASAVQELVAAWKLMWRWRRNRRKAGRG